MTALLQALSELPARQASELQQFVDECREHGHSWAEIGCALGISKSGAHAKYSRQPSKEGRAS